jgi:hypothetical protein
MIAPFAAKREGAAQWSVTADEEPPSTIRAACDCKGAEARAFATLTMLVNRAAGEQ